MWDISIALLFDFLALAAIGFGPVLFFLSDENREPAVLCLSPAVGFVVTSILTSYLVLLDCPILRGAPLILIAGMVVSTAFTLAAILSGGKAPAPHRAALLPVLGFVILCALTAAPQIVGGLKYSILRGNGTDSFNYITTAGYLDHEPYSWAPHADIRTVIERHPAYEGTRVLLRERWTTAAMLAFTSRIGGAPPIRFDYFFSVLSLLLAFGPAYLFGRSLLGIGVLPSILSSLSICGGFWAQLILDMRADSQMNSVPVLLTLAFLIARTAGDGGAIWRRDILLIAATLASLLLFYPEILPMTFAAGALFVALALYRRLAPPRTISRLGAAACLAAIAVLPMWPLLAGFLSKQAGLTTTNNTWDRAYFAWLYSSPLSGMWGFGPLAALRPWLLVVCVTLGAILTVVLAMALWRALASSAEKREGAVLAGALALACLAQWAYFCFRQRWWVAGKGLSFGYPFLILSVAAYAFRDELLPSDAWRRRWAMAAKTGVYGMLAIQCGLLCVRPLMAYRGWEYPNYILGHGEYRRHDWNMAPFAETLKAHRGAIVWSDLSNPWVTDYFALTLGWDARVIDIGSSRDLFRIVFGWDSKAVKELASRHILEPNVPQPRLDRAPEYVLVENGVVGSFDRDEVAAHNTELSLLRAAGQWLPILDIENPNGLEGGPGARFFWLGTKPTTLTLLSPEGGRALLCGSFIIGPSNPTLAEADVIISSDASPDERLRIRPRYQQFEMSTKSPLTHLTIHVENPAIRFLPNDGRPLLLRVDDLRVRREDSGGRMK